MRVRFLFLSLILIAIFVSCTGSPPEEAEEPSPDERSESTGGPPFSDITVQAGIEFTHFNDASARKYLPETMGSGVAFFDYDNDGRPDLFFVNGSPLRRGERDGSPGALYRNVDGTRFEEVTSRAGLSESIYGMGAAIGDIDNDGHLDLFISGVNKDLLYRNRGDGTFENVTRRFGLTDRGFGSSAAFLDYDRDGFLDLFVGRYVKWSLETDVVCSPDGEHKFYCTPEVYPGQSNRLYRNIDGTRFQDVTQSAGVFIPEGKTLGVVILDHNQDGWPDIAVANDTVRNFLFVNNRDGTFSEAGVMAGMAYSESGSTRGGMGIDSGDVDADGFTDLLIGNFSQEMSALYRAHPGGFFTDDAGQVGIGIPTLMTLAFGTLLADLDSDGWLDIVIINGHIEPDIAQTQRLQTYAQPPQFFRNEGHGHFAPLVGPEGTSMVDPLVGRGLAAADMDGDGDLDLAVTQNGRPARLLRNDAAPQAWIRLRLVGRDSNRDGYGSVVRAAAGDKVWTRSLVSGRSYLSACERVLTIGLGQTSSLDRLEIDWPSGKRQVLENVVVNRLHVVEEPLD